MLPYNAMRVLIIGAQGQLGTDLRRVLPADTVGMDLPAFDVCRADQVRAVLARERPDCVINCAAQTNVDRCELEPGEAFAVNAHGAMHVAQAAAEVGARVIYISTDYVFGGDGERAEPYTESDRPMPLNVYGASKLAGEHLTLAYQPRSLVVRTSGLYGHAGARGKGGNFVETMLRLAASQKLIRVVADQRLSPTSTVELADRLVALLQCNAQGIVHVAAADGCTWFEFAREIFAVVGLEVDLQPVATSEYPVQALRPALSALRSERLEALGVPPCRAWRAMLREYLPARPQPAGVNAAAVDRPPDRAPPTAHSGAGGASEGAHVLGHPPHHGRRDANARQPGQEFWDRI
jgi:dTDP-4-dehydrorhamnose reductase